MALKGKSKAAKKKRAAVEPCRHPVTRRIGRGTDAYCGACGARFTKNA